MRLVLLPLECRKLNTLNLILNTTKLQAYMKTANDKFENIAVTVARVGGLQQVKCRC
jgi:hypothetical protein